MNLKTERVLSQKIVLQSQGGQMVVSLIILSEIMQKKQQNSLKGILLKT